MKVTVEAPVYISIVLSLKAYKSNLPGNCKIFYSYAIIKMFSPQPSPTLNWKRCSSRKTNNFEKSPINYINLVLIVIERKQNKSQLEFAKCRKIGPN